MKGYEFKYSGGIIFAEAFADNILHIVWSPNGKIKKKNFNGDGSIETFTDPYAKLNCIDMEQREFDTYIRLTTSKVTAVISRIDGSISFYGSDGKLILSENSRTAEPVVLSDGNKSYKITQTFNSPENERLFGFGNVNERLGIKDEKVVLRQDNTCKRTPMFISNMGYSILFDITSNGLFSRSDRDLTYSYTGCFTDTLDYYFFYGPDMDDVIGGYRAVTGKAAMLPKNAFGYTQSRNRYKSAEEAEKTVDLFRKKNIPIDNIVIDYCWWDNIYFNNFSVEGEEFKNIDKLMENLHSKNVTAAVSVWATAVKNDKNPTYKELIAEDKEILLNNGNSFGFPYDASKEKYRLKYWDMLNKYVFSKGVDTLWLDANEPEMGNWCKEEGEKTAYGSSQKIGLIYPLLDNKTVYEQQRKTAGNKKRVNTLSRCASAGIQRYGVQSWSGDIEPGFKQLKEEIKGVLNFSAAGLPYFSTDTGGYFGIDVNDDEEREMFLRWLQFSAFTSIMRVHGRDSVREPWQFGKEYEGYITDYIKLRERLIPYTYSLAGSVTHRGYTIVRPLVFDFRLDDEAVNVQDQFMFGSAFMAAPVYEQGCRSREVYFPKGRWFDYWTGEKIESGGMKIKVNAPLTEIPLFVRAGSIIPMAAHDIYHANETLEELNIFVYRGADGSFTLYEDEGNGYAYEDGEFSKINFKWNDKENRLIIGSRRGEFKGILKKRIFNIIFENKNSKSIEYDGTEVMI